MTWVDFKALRAQIDFAEVLKHYGVELKTRKGDQHQGLCPLPTHQRNQRSPSFSVNLAKGIWQCFGCGASGNALDLACRLEGLDPANGKDVRTTALKLQERFGLTSGKADAKSHGPREGHRFSGRSPRHQQGVVNKNAERGATRPAIVNAPLDFALTGIDPNYPYLKSRGFTDETVAFFGLGYCSRGTFQGRVVIPLHNSEGELIGYAGREIDDERISKQNPKYKFPSSRLHEDQVYEFRKSQILYNLHRLTLSVMHLIVVEGFASTWWLYQHGYPDVVAVMGDSCSQEQAELIIGAVTPDGCVWVFTDGDESGNRCSASILTQVSPKRCVRWAQLASGEQPTDCTADELSALLPASSSLGGDDADSSRAL